MSRLLVNSITLGNGKKIAPEVEFLDGEADEQLRFNDMWCGYDVGSFFLKFLIDKGGSYSWNVRMDESRRIGGIAGWLHSIYDFDYCDARHISLWHDTVFECSEIDGYFVPSSIHFEGIIRNTRKAIKHCASLESIAEMHKTGSEDMRSVLEKLIFFSTEYLCCARNRTPVDVSRAEVIYRFWDIYSGIDRNIWVLVNKKS